MSNEKQIGLGLLGYVQDYDETLPIAYYGSTPDNYKIVKWVDMIYPYVKSEAVFTCPSRTSEFSDHYTYQYVDHRTGRYYGTYFLNGSYSGDTTNVPATSPAGAALSVIKEVASTVFVLEAPNTYSQTYSTGLNPNAKGAVITFDVSQGSPSWVNTTRKPVEVAISTGNGDKAIFVAPHFGRTNTLFCDGHAKSYDPKELMGTHPKNGKTVNYLFTAEED